MSERKPTAGNGKLNVDQAVRDRYSTAATQRVDELCCPVDYDQRYLEVIPEEVLRKDYGCGDPSRDVGPGETVLDLGSGGGKICFIAAQIVGAEGRVIGVDCNDDMLSLARKHAPHIAERIGYSNVEFRKGRIQDLKLNLELLDEYLAEHPATSSTDWLRVQEHSAHLRNTVPLVEDHSVDVVLSNCVLNLVDPENRRQLFSEIYRVLKRGGRAVISDIVSDETVPAHLRNDPKLWSGCISGAHREDEFLQAFENAGFYGIEIIARQEQPWAAVEGIEFRSMTVRAFKGKDGPCLERKQAVIYKGPWKAVIDDDGHKLIRGQRMAVCDKTYHIYGRSPYADQIEQIAPRQDIPLDDAVEFDCHRTAVRPPQETKDGASDQDLNVLPDSECCGPGECC